MSDRPFRASQYRNRALETRPASGVAEQTGRPVRDTLLDELRFRTLLLVLAARLFGAAASVRKTSGVPMPPILGAGYERDLATARRQLGSRRFEAAWADGALMKVENLVEYASRALNDEPRSRAASSDVLSQREREVVALLSSGVHQSADRR